MLTLLNLLAAVALLVWGSHIVRTGIMRVYGSQLRRVLGNSMQKMPIAFLSGVGVTALVQSSNATALLVTSFAGQGLVALAPALVIMLGADVGTALMARILTFNLSWLSPLFILLGVFFFLSRKQSTLGQTGRISIGLGLILLSLNLIVAAATPIMQAAGVKVLFSTLTGDPLLDALIGALFAIVSYSSLAAVLLASTLTATGVISLKVALCLVIGTNLGSGLLMVMNAGGQSAAARRVALGNLLFKLIGYLIILPFIPYLAQVMEKWPIQAKELVIYFHVVYNLIRCLAMLPLVKPMSYLCNKLITENKNTNQKVTPHYLDKRVLDTPSLALANATRETLRIGDLIEQMLMVYNDILHNKSSYTKETRLLDDDVDTLYSAIKLYLAQLQKESLIDTDARRWAEIIETAMNLEEAGDIIERMTHNVAVKTSNSRCAFSPEGLTELDNLHELLLANLRLSLSVFLSQDIVSAKRLRRSKYRFRILHRRYAYAHVERLHRNNLFSLESSSLHLGLLGDMKRLNSLFCAVAYHVLEQDEQEDEKTWEDAPSEL